MGLLCLYYEKVESVSSCIGATEIVPGIAEHLIGPELDAGLRNELPSIGGRVPLGDQPLANDREQLAKDQLRHRQRQDRILVFWTV
jgi:hypothetical protein